MRGTALILSLFLLAASPSLAGSPNELLKRANSLFKSGDYRKALRVYEELLREGEGAAPIYNNVGVIYVKLYEETGDESYLKKAIAFFALASSVDPSYSLAERNLEEVLNGYISERVDREVSKRLREIERKKSEKKEEPTKESTPYQPISDEEVLNFLKEWSRLWEKKDERYFSLYSPNGCMDFKRFVRYKKRIWKRSKNIKVEIQDIHVRHNPDNSVCVTFRQLYTSSVMKSKARKALCLRKEGGRIRIYCEWFIPTVRIE